MLLSVKYNNYLNIGWKQNSVTIDSKKVTGVKIELNS